MEYVSTVENSKVELTQSVANLFITVSFGFWWVLSFLMEKSNRRGFNRASVKRSLNFFWVPLEIFHFNLLIQSVFQRGDDKNNFFPSVGILLTKITVIYIWILNDILLGFFILGLWIKNYRLISKCLSIVGSLYYLCLLYPCSDKQRVWISNTNFALKSV